MKARKIIDFRAKIGEVNLHLSEMGIDNLFESNIGMAIFINLCEEARNLTKNGPQKTRTLKIVLAVSFTSKLNVEKSEISDRICFLCRVLNSPEYTKRSYK